MPLVIGSRLGPYEILSPLGSGERISYGPSREPITKGTRRRSSLYCCSRGLTPARAAHAPAPMSLRTSYAPRRTPGARDIEIWAGRRDYTAEGSAGKRKEPSRMETPHRVHEPL